MGAPSSLDCQWAVLGTLHSPPEWKGLSTEEHSHRVKVANLFTNPLEVLKTLYAQSHMNNELMVLIDLGRYASLLGHPPSAVIDKLKKLASAVLAMRGPGMRGKTKVLILPPCFDLSGEMDFILNFIEPLHLTGSISGSPRSTAESLP